jgi:hypothetical protein
MHLQVVFRQPGLELGLEGHCFLLGTAVHQPVIGIPTPWEFGVRPRHPKVKRVVHKKIGQDWADHAPYTKGNLDLWGPLILPFGPEMKGSECCDEW